MDHVKDYQNRRRERDDFDEEKERIRLMKIIPKRLHPKDWSSGEYNNTKNSSIKEANGAKERLESDRVNEEDPMGEYLDRKNKKKKRHHGKKHRKESSSRHHHHKHRSKHDGRPNEATSRETP